MRSNRHHLVSSQFKGKGHYKPIISSIEIEPRQYRSPQILQRQSTESKTMIRTQPRVLKYQSDEKKQSTTNYYSQRGSSGNYESYTYDSSKIRNTQNFENKYTSRPEENKISIQSKYLKSVPILHLADGPNSFRKFGRGTPLGNSSTQIGMRNNLKDAIESGRGKILIN